ncbi:MAG: lysophospholipid acyltransferase family protein, partial [Parachlamydiaceae bacterium]
RALSQKAGALSVERSKGSAALKIMTEQARKFMLQNRSLLIFPEGTRTPAFNEGRYLPGIYAIAQNFPDVSVIPAAINSGAFWPSKKPILRSGEIILEFLPPMDNGLSRKEFMSALKEKIENKTRELEVE